MIPPQTSEQTNTNVHAQAAGKIRLCIVEVSPATGRGSREYIKNIPHSRACSVRFASVQRVASAENASSSVSPSVRPSAPDFSAPRKRQRDKEREREKERKKEGEERELDAHFNRTTGSGIPAIVFPRMPERAEYGGLAFRACAVVVALR